MESLNSFKDVYSDFKTDLENKMSQRKGRIKDGIIYGEYYDLPITKNKIVYYFHQEDRQNPVFRMMADYMLSDMKEKEKSFFIIISNKVQKEALPAKYRSFILEENRREAKEAVACAEFIIAGNGLPKYFVKKKQQMVIRFLSFVKEKPGRSWLAQNRISWFMNSSLIFVETEEEKRILEIDYQLKGLFEGEIAVISENQIKKNWIPELRRRRSENDKQSANLDISRKKILILNGQGMREEGKMIGVIADSLDSRQYDITLAMKKAANIEDEEINNLNSNVRLIYREGSFSCSMEEYIDIQYLLKNFHAFEDLERAYKFLNQRIVQRECRRLWGNVEFDAVIYVGNHSAVWPVIAGGVKAKKKIRIESRNLEQEEQRRQTKNKKKSFLNMMQLYQLIFDKIIFPSKSDMIQAIKRHFIMKGKGEYFYYPAGNVVPEQENSKNLIWYQKDQFFVASEKISACGRGQIELLPLPNEKKKAYIIDGDLHCIEEILKEIQRGTLLNQDMDLTICAVERYDSKRLRERYQINYLKIIDRDMLTSSPFMSGYLRYFEGCIAAAEWKFSPIRISMEFLGKEILVYKNQKLIRQDEKCFNSEQDYLSYMEKSWEEILMKK